MPELPEVETILRGLAARALGRRITAVKVWHSGVIVGLPGDFCAAVSGGFIRRLDRKGKALAIELGTESDGPSRFLLVRLGMTGQFVVTSRKAPLQPHTHVQLSLDDGSQELRYRDPRRFGRLRCCSAGELEAVFGRLGPDAQRISEAQFLAGLKGRHGAIKSWLMNQEFLSGIGNIYADEALFLARVHPLTRAGWLSPVAERHLYRAVRRVLDHAVTLQGTSFRDYIDIEGRPGNFLPRLRVYQRTGRPCHRCHQPIQRLIVAGRSTHYCPRCQKRPRRAATRRGPR